MFNALVKHARESSPAQLAEVLGPLCDSQHVMPDSTEGQMIPHIQHFRWGRNLKGHGADCLKVIEGSLKC